MKPQLIGCLALLILAWPGRDAPADTGLPPRGSGTLLDPMVTLSAAIDRGVEAFLSGKSFAESFPDWTVESRATADRIRKEIRSAGGRTSSTVWIGTDVLFEGPGGGLRLHTQVLTADPEARFLRVAWSPGGRTASGISIKTLENSTAPIGKALQALLEAIPRSAKAPDLLVGPREIRRAFTRPLSREALEQSLPSAKESWDEAWERLRQIHPENVTVILDDVEIRIRDGAGRDVGTLKADFDTRASTGVFEWALERFRPR